MKIATVFALASPSAFAQLDRAGNVLNDDGYVSNSTISLVFWCTVIGCVGGALYAKFKQSKGEDFAVDGGVIIGGFFGFIVLPFIYVLATK